MTARERLKHTIVDTGLVGINGALTIADAILAAGVGIRCVTQQQRGEDA